MATYSKVTRNQFVVLVSYIWERRINTSMQIRGVSPIGKSIQYSQRNITRATHVQPTYASSACIGLFFFFNPGGFD